MFVVVEWYVQYLCVYYVDVLCEYCFIIVLWIKLDVDYVEIGVDWIVVVWYVDVVFCLLVVCFGLVV